MSDKNNGNNQPRDPYEKFIQDAGMVEFLKSRALRINGNIAAIRKVKQTYPFIHEDLEPLFNELKADGYAELEYTRESLESDLKHIEGMELNNECQREELENSLNNLNN